MGCFELVQRDNGWLSIVIYSVVFWRAFKDQIRAIIRGLQWLSDRVAKKKDMGTVSKIITDVGSAMLWLLNWDCSQLPHSRSEVGHICSLVHGGVFV